MIALLLATDAFGATIAVLDLWGPQVSRVEAQDASEQLRAAFVAEGRLDPVSGPDIADGVSAGQEEVLRAARDRMGEARRLYETGEPRAARAALYDAIVGFTKARSIVGRRDELADAYFLDGICAADTGDAVTARKAFERALRLVPDHDERVSFAVNELAVGPLRAAKEGLGFAKVELPDEALLKIVAASLDVDVVAVGTLEPDGTVSLEVHDADGKALGTLVAHTSGVPTVADDPAWRTLAEGVARRVDAARAPARTTSTPEAPAPVAAAEETAESTPVSGRWWFWLLMAGLVGGGAAAVAIAAAPEEGEVQTTPDSWTVTVELPD